MPLFDPSSEQKPLLDLAGRLADTVLKPRADEVDRTARFPAENFAELAKAGLYGLRIPRRWGGLEADTLTAVRVIERLAMACGSTAMCFKMHCESTDPIWRLATPEQVERFVKPIARGERLVTSAIAEAGTGSHVWNLQSFATKRPDGGYELTQVKKGWVTSSLHADLYTCPIRVGQETGFGKYTCFVLERAALECTIDAPWGGLGMRANASSPMTFKGSVGAIGRLGEEHVWASDLAPKNFSPFSLVTFAAVFLGIAEGAYEEAMAHVTGRVSGDTGSHLGKIESVQRYIGEMRLSLDRTRALVYEVARQVDRGDIRDLRTLIQAKCAADETAIEVTRIALNLGGGKSYGGGNAIGRYFRDAHAGALMAPTDDLSKLRIARYLLGLPQFG